MNTYLIPIYDKSNGNIYIEDVQARSLSAAEDTIIDRYLPEDEDFPNSWEDFLAVMVNNRIVIGDLYEISEFY